MSNYILTLQLKTEKFQEDIICNIFISIEKYIIHVYQSYLKDITT